MSEAIIFENMPYNLFLKQRMEFVVICGDHLASNVMRVFEREMIKLKEAWQARVEKAQENKKTPPPEPKIYWIRLSQAQIIARLYMYDSAKLKKPENEDLNSPEWVEYRFKKALSISKATLKKAIEMLKELGFLIERSKPGDEFGAPIYTLNKANVQKAMKALPADPFTIFHHLGGVENFESGGDSKNFNVPPENFDSGESQKSEVPPEEFSSGESQNFQVDIDSSIDSPEDSEIDSEEEGTSREDHADTGALAPTTPAHSQDRLTLEEWQRVQDEGMAEGIRSRIPEGDAILLERLGNGSHRIYRKSGRSIGELIPVGVDVSEGLLELITVDASATSTMLAESARQAASQHPIATTNGQAETQEETHGLDTAHRSGTDPIPASAEPGRNGTDVPGAGDGHAGKNARGAGNAAQATARDVQQEATQEAVKRPVVKRDAQQLSTLQASSAQASGKASAVEMPPAPFSPRLSQFFDHAIESAQQAASQQDSYSHHNHEEDTHGLDTAPDYSRATHRNGSGHAVFPDTAAQASRTEVPQQQATTEPVAPGSSGYEKAAEKRASAHVEPRVLDVRTLTLKAHAAYIFHWLDMVKQEAKRDPRACYAHTKTAEGQIVDLITSCWNSAKELTEENVRKAWGAMWNEPAGRSGFSWKKAGITLKAFCEHYSDYLEKAWDSEQQSESKSSSASALPSCAHMNDEQYAAYLRGATL